MLQRLFYFKQGLLHNFWKKLQDSQIEHVSKMSESEFSEVKNEQNKDIFLLNSANSIIL